MITKWRTLRLKSATSEHSSTNHRTSTPYFAAESRRPSQNSALVFLLPLYPTQTWTWNLYTSSCWLSCWQALPALISGYWAHQTARTTLPPVRWHVLVLRLPIGWNPAFTSPGHTPPWTSANAGLLALPLSQQICGFSNASRIFIWQRWTLSQWLHILMSNIELQMRTGRDGRSTGWPLDTFVSST